MSAAYPKTQGHSADVRMQLFVNGQTFTIAQLGPQFIILDDPVDCPPAEGEIMVSIDGHVQRWGVSLPDGIVAGSSETRVSKRPLETNGAARSVTGS